MAGERPSVVHVTEPVDGGVARYVAQAAAEQVGRGWSVAVVSPPHPPFLAEIGRSGADHHAWALPVRLMGDRARSEVVPLLRGLRPLARVLAARRPDVVHLHSAQAGLAGRLVLRGRISTVFQPHAWSFLAVRGLPRRAAVRWERSGARWASVVVCSSEGERRLAEAVGIRARFRVVPNGIDVAAHVPASGEERRAARRRLGLEDAPTAVSIGRLARQKGHDVLLAAWPSVVTRVPAADLVIVGDGPDRAALDAAARPGIRLVGHRDDVPAWLDAADVVVLPSRWEGGTPLVLLDAMARARSAVVADVPGADAVGDGGAVVPAEDPAALADAIAERLLDPALAAAEGVRARARVERRHDLSTTLDLLADVYGEAAPRARPGRWRPRPDARL